MIYKLKHPDHPGLAKILTDTEGELLTVYVDGTTLIASLNVKGTWDEDRLAALKEQGYIITVERGQTTQERIALWCKLYKHFKGLPYRVSAADSGKMKNMVVTEPLLRYYLDDTRAEKAGSVGWLWKGKQSIANLARYWNEVRTAMVAPEPSKHPNTWSPEHLKKLSGPDIGEYHKHLKRIGLVPKHHRDGSIMDYVPAE